MAEPTDIGKNLTTAEKMVRDATSVFREYMEIPFIPEEEEFLFKAFGGKPGQGKVKTPKKLTPEQAMAFLDYSGFPLADENAKFSIASSIKLGAPELFDDASFKDYEKKFGSVMEMQEKGASASKNITTAKTPKAANEPMTTDSPTTKGKSGAVSFNKEFTSRITESGESRGDALRGSTLVDIIQNRQDISNTVKTARIKVIRDLGFEDIKLGDITDKTPVREQFLRAIVENGSNSQISAFVGDFKKVLAEVGVTAQGTTNPFRTMMREAVGEEAYKAAGFTTDTARLIPVNYPREVYSESKRVAAGLMEDPKTRPAGGRMLLMMMGGYRPSDFKALRIENINFETGLVKGLELKTDDGKKNVKIGYLPEPQRDIIRSIIGDKTNGLVFSNPAGLDKTINTALANSNIPEIEYLQESTGNYVKQKFTNYDFRRVNETNLSSKGYNDNDIVRKVLTWRPPSGNVQKYQAVIDQSGAIEEANARAFEPYVLLSQGNTTTSDGTTTKTHGQFLTEVGVTQLSPFTQRYVVTSDAVSKLPVYLQDTVAQESVGVTFSDKPISNVKINVDPAASTTYKELSAKKLEVDLLKAETEKRNLEANMPPKQPSVSVDPGGEASPSLVQALEDNGFSMDDIDDIFDNLMDKGKTTLKTAGAALGTAFAGTALYEAIRDPGGAGAAMARDMAIEGAALAARTGAGVAGALPSIVDPSLGVELQPSTLDDTLDDPSIEYSFTPARPDGPMPLFDERGMVTGSPPQDSGMIPEPSRVPEAAPAQDQGFLSR